MQKPLYSGKAKSIYTTDDSDILCMQFRDDFTAFNAKKCATIARKGAINNQINTFIMQYLESNNVPTHFVRQLSSTEALVHALDMISVECVVRNYATGSLCRRLGVEEGITLEPPIFEFFYKNDELNDPFINESQMLTLGWATAEEITTMQQLSFRVNELLKPLFLKARLLLVDYKLEFGRLNGQVVLGDELTPDGCRLWDTDTLEKMDKDRFRQDLGGVVEAYEEVAKRLGITLVF